MPITSLLYPQSHNSSQHSHPHPHQHQKTTRSGITPAARQALTYSTYSAHSNCTSDSFYSNSSTLTPMTTDDDASSTASHRPRTRLLSPPGSVPSPLSTYNYTGGNHSTGNIHHPHQHPGHERSVSFTSSSAPPPSAPLSGQARLAVIDVNPKTTTIQLKVKHLARSIVHSGYLSKYVPRTFFSRKQWKRRYFILDRRSLHCFKSSDPRHPLLESIELCAEANVYVTDAFPGKRYCIQISCPNERDWYVLADTAPEMSAWLRELKAIVSQFRTGHPGEGGVSGSHFSEDTVSISSASGQDHHLLHPGSTTASDYGRSTPRSGSPLPRPTDPFHPHGQMTSLSPPPRSLTPKPPTPIPASSVRSTTAEREVAHPTRRRNNSNVFSTGHSVNDYISIHSVMAQAEALDLSDTHSVSSHHDHGLVFPSQLPSVPSAHRRALSNASVHSSQGSGGPMDGAVAVFGGAVARKSSSQHRRFLSGGGSPSGGSMTSGSIGISTGLNSGCTSGSEPPVIMSHRLSALISNGVHIPLPPTSVLPPVPTSTSSPPPSLLSAPSSPPPLTPSPPPVVATVAPPASDQMETTTTLSKADATDRVVKSLNLPPAPLGPPPAVTVAVAAAMSAPKVTTIAPIAEEDEGEEEADQNKAEEKDDVGVVVRAEK
ncbi:hypothetical protein DFQ27_000543, partial [Actinomortierella ambigua]